MDQQDSQRSNTTDSQPKCVLALSALKEKALDINSRSWPPRGSEPVESEVLALEDEWAGIVKTDGVSAIDAFIAWEGEHLGRLGLAHPVTLLQDARDLLSRSGRVNVNALLEHDIVQRATAFQASTATEAEMATAVCGLWWRRDFSGLLCTASNLPLEDWFLETPCWPDGIDIPGAMWDLANIEPSRDPATFHTEVYAADLVERTILIGGDPHAAPRPVHRRFNAVRTPEDLDVGWLRDALLGGIPGGDDLRPGILALLWAVDVGILRPGMWSVVQRFHARREQARREVPKDWMAKGRVPSTPPTALPE